jgi:hypothetical protein
MMSILVSEATVYAPFTNKVYLVWLKSALQLFLGIFVNHFFVYPCPDIKTFSIKISVAWVYIIAFISLGYILRWVVVTAYIHQHAAETSREALITVFDKIPDAVMLLADQVDT